MAASVEKLSPLDVIMPPTYVQANIFFRTNGSDLSAIHQKLQDGLDKLVTKFPWLGGQVHRIEPPQAEKATLEVRWDVENSSAKLFSTGTVPASYEDLAAKGMPLDSVPASFLPSTPPMTALQAGAPVFIATVFDFSDGKGVGLSVCLHHNFVDGAGAGVLLRTWADLVADTSSSFPGPVSAQAPKRVDRISATLNDELEALKAETPEALLARHPEYSLAPPAFPTEFAASTAKLFAIPAAKIEAMRVELVKLSGNEKAPSTGNILSALIWQVVTRARIVRTPSLANQQSKLVTAVNGRARISQEQLCEPTDPYLGNAVLYALGTLDAASDSHHSTEALARVCDAIARSQSTETIDRRHIAEIHSGVDRFPDYRAIFPGWDLFNSRDLTITSWADLRLYEWLNFGSVVGGKPEFVRVPYMEADGVGMLLPRRKALSGSEDVLFEVAILLRRDDLEALEADEAWKGLIQV